MGILRICALAALASLPAHAMAEPANVSAQAPWKPIGERAYAIDFSSASRSASLSFSSSCEAESFYKVAWIMGRGAKAGSPQAVLDFASEAGRFSISYAVPERKGLCYAYFYAAKEGDANLGLSPARGASGSIEVKGISVERLTQEDLNGNAVVDGDFESSGSVPSAWMNYESKHPELSIVPNPEFLAGKRCMAADFRPDANGFLGAICSIRLPVTIGKEHELKLWTRAESDFTFNLGVQTWSAFGHKGSHFNAAKTFKSAKEWNEISFRFKVPKDLSKFPDLASDRTVFIFIQGRSGDGGRVLFDNISLAPVNP